MRKQRYDGSEVRIILIAMATNETVCSRIASRWPQEGLFEAQWSNLVGSWCVDHQRKFGRPPQKRLTQRFLHWAEHSGNEDAVVSAVEGFLQDLSNQYDRDQNAGESSVADSDYLLNLAARHFDHVAAKKVVKQAQVFLDIGRTEDAFSQLSSLRHVQLGSDAVHMPAEDYEEWEAAFQEDRRRPLITYPGAAGQFISDAFCRGELYAFEGPDKTGKSSILRDLTYRAVRSRRRVAFFDTGDGNYHEFLLQLGMRATGASETGKPVGWPDGFNDKGELITSERRPTIATAIDGFMEVRKLCRGVVDQLRVECHANGTLSVTGIDATLAEWALDGWRPDVVVIDYADILAPPDGVTDPLQQIDQTWRQLRRMSQSRDCLVVTATQSNAAAYGNEKKLLGRKHFSGRKTKNAEVNGMIGINVSEDERKQQLARWNWVVRRKDRRAGVVVVAGCYDVGNPVVCSRW